MKSFNYENELAMFDELRKVEQQNQSIKPYASSEKNEKKKKSRET